MNRSPGDFQLQSSVTWYSGGDVRDSSASPSSKPTTSYPGLPTWGSSTILFDVTMRLQPFEMHTCLAIECIFSISVKCYMVQRGGCQGLFSKSKLETNNFLPRGLRMLSLVLGSAITYASVAAITSGHANMELLALSSIANRFFTLRFGKSIP
ncbi:uncharacterized protein LOC143855496 isoform X2 [Tasmannia lanceolata]|uniref:uncharacterized protein LOC143855496 isoform X2 n=1 Tax=Tasmannia lanceolata TaxID=3420 RepID=UPI0040635CBE